MRLLVTRPQPDADELAARLHGLGHEAIVSPLLEIRCRPFAVPAADSLDGIVVTSRNALACLAEAGHLAPLQPLPLFAVGAATAGAARAMGFTQVIEGPGQASDLVAVIAARFPAPAGKRLWYAAGEEKAFDLAPALAALGLGVESATVYATVAATALSPQAANHLAAGRLAAVLLMSPRTARVFAGLIRAGGIERQMANVACLCLSGKVAAALGDLVCREKPVAARPDLAALLQLVATLA